MSVLCMAFANLLLWLSLHSVGALSTTHKMAVVVGSSSSSGESSSSSSSSHDSPFAYDSDCEFDDLGTVGVLHEPPRLAYWKGSLESISFDGNIKVLHTLCEFCAHNELLNIEHVRRAGHPSGWLCGDAVGPAVLHWVEQLQAVPARSSSARSRSPPVSRCGFDVC